jgi:hypothetical protein
VEEQKLSAQLVAQVVVFALGVATVAFTLASSIRTVILPRGVPSRLTRVVFLITRWLFELRGGPNAPYERRDRVMALYAPVSLLAMLIAWLAFVVGGFTAMFWALGNLDLLHSFLLSGASITTLGNVLPPSSAAAALTFVEAAVGLVLLALLITYLPSIYSAFSRRENAVAALEVRAGTPPTGSELIWRYWVLGRIELLGEIWTTWENWFVDIEETHTSFPALVFFRSPQPDHSWVTAAGAVLDGAAIMVSTVDRQRDVQAEICIRAGYLALRRIADFFTIPFDPDPAPHDPISVTREEFDAALVRLEEAGTPLKSDRDAAWRDYAGWRVNYDSVLLALATLTVAPETPWSSDRASGRRHRPPILRRRPSGRRS